MNIYKIAYVNRHGRQIGEIENYDTLSGVSTLLWAEEIPHECKLNADDGEVDESGENWTINSSGFNLTLGYRF